MRNPERQQGAARGRGWRADCILGKQFAYKCTHMVQTHLVQGSAIMYEVTVRNERHSGLYNTSQTYTEANTCAGSS